METLAEICKTYKEKYPLVQIVLHTATADAVYEMINKGIVDIALFMEPVDTEGMDYIRITDCDHWCVGMRPDDPLANKIVKDQLGLEKCLENLNRVINKYNNTMKLAMDIEESDAEFYRHMNESIQKLRKNNEV